MLTKVPAEGAGGERRRWTDGEVGPLLSGSAWLVATAGVTAFAGFLFWLVAAHSQSQQTIGRASALYSAVLFVNYSTNMGLPIAVARYAPDDTATANVLFAWSLMYSGATSIIGALVLVAVGPASMLGPLWQWGKPGGVALVVTLVTSIALTVLVDVRMMTMRMWRWVFARAAIAGALRLGLVLIHPRVNGALWVLVSFTASVALSVAIGAFVLHRRNAAVFRLGPVPPNSGAAFRYASLNYLGQLAVQAPFIVLPMIVALRVSASANGAFYVAWSIAAVIFLVPQVVSQALLIEGGKSGSRLDQQTRVATVLTVGFAVVAGVAVALGARIVTLVYGQSYARTARLLPALVLPVAAWAITSTCLARARVRHDDRATIAIPLVLAVSVLLPALLLTGRLGATGAAEAWVIGHIVAAIVSAALLKLDGRPSMMAAAPSFTPERATHLGL